MAYVMSFRHLVSASVGLAGGLHFLTKDGIPLIVGIFKRRARAGEGGGPSLRLSCFFACACIYAPGPILKIHKSVKVVKKVLPHLFVGLGRLHGVWGGLTEGVVSF